MKRPLVIGLIGLVLIGATYVGRQRVLEALEGQQTFGGWSDAYERAEAAEAAIPPIPVSVEGRGRYFLNSVFVWNGTVVASMDTRYPPRDTAQRFWLYNESSDQFVPHPLRNELQWLIGGSRSLAVVRVNGASDLVEFHNFTRTMLMKNVAAPENCAITYNDRVVFVVFPGSVQAIDTTGRIVSSAILEPEISAAEASPSALLVSCDQGEFGGAVAMYPIASDGRVGSRKQLAETHVSWTDQDEQHNVWLWGKFAHLGLRSSALYVYSAAGGLRDLRSGGKVGRPDAVAVESAGQVLVLSGNEGISRVDVHGRTKELWHGRTSIVYGADQVGNRHKDVPRAMALWKNRLFVASEGLGIYEFEQIGDEIRFLRQIHLSPAPAANATAIAL